MTSKGARDLAAACPLALAAPAAGQACGGPTRAARSGSSDSCTLRAADEAAASEAQSARTAWSPPPPDTPALPAGDTAALEDPLVAAILAIAAEVGDAQLGELLAATSDLLQQMQQVATERSVQPPSA